MSELLLDRAGRRRPPATIAGVLRRPPAAQQRSARSRRPAHGGGDHRRHARRRRRRPRPPAARVDRHLWRAGRRIQEALALAEADLDRRRGSLPCPSRQGRTPPRGRHGRVGLGRTRAMGFSCGPSCPSDRCSASSTGRRAGASGPTPPPGPTCATSRSPPAFAVALRRTNSATRTPSNWRAKA
jgi:hypothetical protein